MKLDQLIKLITPLPWSDKVNDPIPIGITERVSTNPTMCMTTEQALSNHAFALHSANALPDLVDEIKSKKCPWPKACWPMTDEEYVKAVPDKHLRTAISGFLMREGWLIARKELKDALARAEEVRGL